MATRQERFEAAIGAGPGITASIHSDVSRIAAKVAAMKGDLARAAHIAMELTLKEMLDDLYIKMSGEPPVSSKGKIPRGPHYLGVRTQKGRSSIRSMIEETSYRIRGSFGPQGPPAVYIVAHEQGFKGEVEIKAHSRVARSGRRVPVRAHNRFMNIPARRFIRAALLEGRPKLHRNVLETMERLFGAGGLIERVA